MAEGSYEGLTSSFKLSAFWMNLLERICIRAYEEYYKAKKRQLGASYRVRANYKYLTLSYLSPSGSVVGALSSSRSRV